MKATDPNNICPYTGLRSFTEEESLYFKGRDSQIDQITSLLEQNKFLMVTGASGEGKSSLIYAGIIPNARAGFFKAKYSNWVVVDFRPERNPVTNMANAVAKQFDINPAYVETELRRGFSSMIDLYTHSPFYLGEDTESLNKLGEKELKEKKRKSSNLLILVDQFEEFFTNPENYNNEILSKDSQIVVNLILETARIAIKKNLPLYVVCTMRSDYIGQCSAFRGLPEYIGFSQFFVPRLKRKDLKQVIEEPALLSGNRITQRLIERLVFDISDGVDQLPILQHALSRIWMAADHGNEEMDLIHYAMVGGMSSAELPDEDQTRFKIWYDQLPDQQKQFYNNTGLAKIIEIHANLLYENSWNHFKQAHPETQITQAEAKRIIALSFSCLTKIDNSRAVRNRMSLEEITSIINSPRLDTNIVGGVLNIFREEGNSFIRPFKTEDPLTYEPSPETVLDITHESLIRNWNKLNQWATREFEYYSTFLDFQKQLNRWKESGKKSGYLLPIGPLSYFENWYNKCKPNAGWILRYTETKDEPIHAKAIAEGTLSDSREFLKKSARKVIATRAFMKYGPQRIATFLAIFLMLVMTGFYWYNADQKKNEKVIERVRAESFERLKSKDVGMTEKAVYLLAEERYKSGSMIPFLQSLDFRDKLSLSIEVYKQILNLRKHEDSPLKNELQALIAKGLETSDRQADPQFLLTQTNIFLILLAMDNYYGPSKAKEQSLITLSQRNQQTVLTFLGNHSMFHPLIPSELNMAIQLWLTVGKVTTSDVQSLINAMSPLSGKEAESTFNLYYPKGSFEANGRQPIDFNGGYHTLATLYAVNGNIANVKWCFDRLLENNQRDYFESARILNNHLNVLGYLYQYGHQNEVPEFLQWLNTHTTDNPPVTILRNAIIRSGYISHLYYINIDRDYYRSTRGLLYPNLCLSDRSVFESMLSDYDKAIALMTDVQDANFTRAMNLKRKVMFYSKYWYDRQMPADTAKLDVWLHEALALYQQLDSAFLEGKVSTTQVYNGDGVRTMNVRRRDLFIYPDYRDGWFSWTYQTDYFFNYLKKNHLLSSIYRNSADLQALHLWVAKAYEYKTEISPESYSNTYPLPDEALIGIIDFVDTHPGGKEFDRNLLYLILANHAYEKGDSSAAMNFYKKLNLETISQSSDKYEYLEKIFFLNMMKSLCGNLARAGKRNEAIGLTEKFIENDQREFSYLRMADKVYREDANPLAFVYLDSAYQKASYIDFSKVNPDFDPRINQILVLSEIGSKTINDNAVALLRDIPEQSKFLGVLARVTGIAYEGNYYRALTSIPNTLTESQDLTCRTIILLQSCRSKETQQGPTLWKALDDNEDRFWNFINYIPN